MSGGPAAYHSDLRDKAQIVGLATRLASHRAYERLRPRTVTDGSEIPAEFGQITVPWLDDVLCAGVPGARVEGFDLGIGHVGTTGRQQMTIDYNDAGREAGLPRSVFAKGTPTLLTRISMSVVPTMKIEADFFNRVRGLVDVEAPVGYHSAYDLRSGRAIHLLEDLVATKNATFPEVTTPITQSQAEDAVDVMAALHARFVDRGDLAVRFAEFQTWPVVYQRMATSMDLERYNQRGMDKAADALPPTLRARRDEVWPAIVRASDVHDRLPHTLIHGDVHLANWYVTGEGRMGLLDWQCVSRGHWSHDLAYALTAILDIEQRRAWERDLLERYRERLHEFGAPTVSFDHELWPNYRQQVLGGFALWTPTYCPPAFAPKNMQPPELSLEMIRRFATAIDDLDSLDVR